MFVNHFDQGDMMSDLYDSLKDYSESDAYPFHMPGHKRNTKHSILKDFPNPYSIDITEIEGFDDLHHANGILKEAMDRTAAIYGADKSYFLVNGSTCGVLSAISATCDNSDTILLARNCHKSAYNGAFLNNLKIVHTYPQFIKKFGINGGLIPAEIGEMLKTHAEIPAVFIVSPTYEGIVSDVETIASICHENKIPLIVDQAHGAHFKFDRAFPDTALDLGADIVIESLHKTLPSFTQTALMHVKSDLVDIDKMEYYLQIYESSSPSYLFMAGIDRCIGFMEADREKGEDSEMGSFVRKISGIREDLNGMKCLRLLDESVLGRDGVFAIDPSRFVISCKDTGMSGVDLGKILRDEYHLEMEMCGPDHVIAITTLMDTDEGLYRLEEALLEIDSRLGNEVQIEEGFCEPQLEEYPCFRPEAVMTIREAYESAKKEAALEESIGKISGEYIYLYPPGCPLIVPGEIIDENVLDTLKWYKQAGLKVSGLKAEDAEHIEILAGSI